MESIASAIPVSVAEGDMIIPMKRWRMWIVFALGAGLIAGHLYDIITQSEHWPFAYYQMYARLQNKPRLELLGLCAIVQNGSKQKQIRITDQGYVPQLSETRLRNILMTSWGRADSPNKHAVRDTSTILRDYLNLYELRRLQHLHDGPPMLEAQLCKVTWHLRPDASRKKPMIEPLLGVRAGGQPLRYFAATTRPATDVARPGEVDVPND